VGLIDGRISPLPRAVFTSDTIRPCCFFSNINSFHIGLSAIYYINQFHTALVKRISKLAVFDADMDPFCGFAFHKPGQQLLAYFREQSIG
jgi:hypothetical protein